MTLFRKVFQNQAQPAAIDGVVDEEGLRAAFNVQNTLDAPLLLDPFEHALNKESSAQPDAHAPEGDAGAVVDMAAETDREDAQDSALEGAAETDLDTVEFGADEYVDEDSTPPADEDINAFVGRALAADDAKSRPVAEVELVDEIEFKTDGAADDPMDASSVEPAPADFDDTDSDDSAATSDDALEAFALSATTDGSADLKEEGPTDEKVTDIAAFAQQQMAALGAPEEEPSAAPDEPPVDLSNTAELAAVPAPAAGRSGRRAGRAKTRLLGFNRSAEESNDPFGTHQEATAAPELNKFPVGWMVIVDGPGEGHSFSIFAGASTIGRGEDQGIRLDFGDNSISRNNHAAVAYDDEENKFYIGHGGKSNIIRRNARPVLSTEELHHADLIRIGETTLRFVALCGSDFRWGHAGGNHEAGV